MHSNLTSGPVTNSDFVTALRHYSHFATGSESVTGSDSDIATGSDSMSDYVEVVSAKSTVVNSTTSYSANSS